MNAAVVKARYKKSDLEKAVKDYKDSVLPAISTHDGARSAVLLVNRETGDGVSIAFDDRLRLGLRSGRDLVKLPLRRGAALHGFGGRRNQLLGLGSKRRCSRLVF